MLILLKTAGQVFKAGDCWIRVENDQSHQLREYREKRKVYSFCFKINELSNKNNFLKIDTDAYLEFTGIDPSHKTSHVN